MNKPSFPLTGISSVFSGFSRRQAKMGLFVFRVFSEFFSCLVAARMLVRSTTQIHTPLRLAS